MIFTGLVRLGQDAELKHTESGLTLLNLSVAYNHGKKGSDGKRPTQWMRLTMFGNRCEGLAPYLTKGSLVNVVVRDLYVREWQTDTKSGVSLEGVLTDVEFAGGGEQKQAAQPQQQSPAQRAHQTGKSNGYQQDAPWDDDVPF